MLLIQEDSLLRGPIDYIPPNIFDSINEDTVFKATSNTKGDAGPSGMDAELYRRMLCSKKFGKQVKNSEKRLP